MAEYVGSRVRFTDDDEVYTGVLKSLNGTTGRLSIDEVECDGCKLSGVLFFYMHEIRDYEIIEAKAAETRIPDDRRGGRLVSAPLETVHLRRLRDVKAHDMILSSAQKQLQRNESILDDNDEWLITGENWTYRSESLDTMITVIAKIDERFVEAIELLREEKVLGVAIQGQNISRLGTLCLIQFSVKDFIIVFDILSLGRSAFEEGLAEILQHPNILKVMHDCRLPSDILFHKYGVSLKNIFDTQVADAVVFRSLDRRNRYPKYVNSVRHCILQYLNDDTDDVCPHRIRSAFKAEDEGVWAHRPLSKLVVDAAARNVCRLRRLRSAMIENLLSELSMGTDLYLAIVRDQPDELCTSRGVRADTVDRRQSHELPAEFCHIPYKIKEHGLRMRRVNTTADGMAENCSGIGSASIVYSNSGAWFHAPWAKSGGAQSRRQSSGRSESSDRSDRSDKSHRADSASPADRNRLERSSARGSARSSPRSPGSTVDSVNPLLKPSLIVQRSRLSANMDLSNGPLSTSTPLTPSTAPFSGTPLSTSTPLSTRTPLSKSTSPSTGTPFSTRTPISTTTPFCTKSPISTGTLFSTKTPPRDSKAHLSNGNAHMSNGNAHMSNGNAHLSDSNDHLSDSNAHLSDSNAHLSDNDALTTHGNYVDTDSDLDFGMIPSRVQTSVFSQTCVLNGIVNNSSPGTI